MVEADFSGYATKAGIKCSDGRTIMKDAFAHQDTHKVPLVWQHIHNDPENVLGHAVLENREDGVYTHAYFNDSPKGKIAKTLVQHGDVVSLSIYANQLLEKAKAVLHGSIKEVSLVLSGANPGALIENVAIRHSDSDVETLDDEAIIFTGLALEHADGGEVAPEEDADDDDDTDTDEGDDVVEHAAGDEKTVQDVYDTFTEEQKTVVNFMIAQALEAGGTTSAQHSDDDTVEHSEGATIQDVYDSFSPQQKQVVDFMVGEALETADTTATATHSDDTDGDTDALNHQEGTDNMTSNRNVFEDATNSGQTKGATLSHAQVKSIFDDAPKFNGSLKESFLAHAQDYGIENIDILFPDARALNTNPDIIGRRQEWVQDVLSGAKHSPFSRIKSVQADITADEARAKGYVKGNLKKDEILKLLKRVTTPTTIYKKQKLDRDDVVDITDLDVVAWLKAEMRIMLDEELARAILIGDGRESDDEDKVDEDHIRPIAFDVDMYSHSITVGSELSPEAIIESILRTRTYYKGTGTPNFYTTDAVLTDMLLIKDKVNRRIYPTVNDLSAALRVNKIVTVEVMDSTPDIVGILVNMTDYTIGADQGGQVNMFDDFDIDYNQLKYLIETRVSGALTKPKSAVVVKRTLGTVVTPTSPSYNGATHQITYPAIAGVVYEVDGTSQTGTVTIDETTDVDARPASGYSFPANTTRNWTYVYTA